MKLLKVGNGKFVNTDRITYIEARKQDKVVIMFQNQVEVGTSAVPSSFLELKGPEAENFMQWLENNTDSAVI